MDKIPSGTSRTPKRCLLASAAAAASFVLAACGSETTHDTRDTAPPRAAAEEPSASPGTRAKTQGDTLNENAQNALEERAKNAAKGDPVAKKSDIPQPEDYGFGRAVETASGGEVTAYEPRVEADRLVVPLTIRNGSDERAAYKVVVTAKSREVSHPVTVQASNVFAGTTWPTQADVTADGLDQPDNVKISLKVTKDLYPLGDGR